MVRPSDFAGLVVDRFEYPFGPPAAIIAAPAFRLVVRIVEVINTEGSRRIDVEQSRLRTETSRRPICRAILVRRHQRTIELWLFFGVGDGLSFGVCSLCPIRFYELRTEDTPAV